MYSTLGDNPVNDTNMDQFSTFFCVSSAASNLHLGSDVCFLSSITQGHIFTHHLTASGVILYVVIMQLLL